MDSPRRPPALNIISSSTLARPVSTSPSPHAQSQSPFRYVQFHHAAPTRNANDAGGTPLGDFSPDEKRRPPPPSSLPSSSRAAPPDGSQSVPSRARLAAASPRPQPSPFRRAPAPLLLPSPRHSLPYKRPRGLRIFNLLRPWIPLILYGITSLGFLLAIAFWKTEVFAALDELSHWLQADEQFGYVVLFSLIFLTTFPPVPLYSTLIILSGYTFGPWTGAIISYGAALTGALTVFLLSRHLLRDTISRWLSSTVTIKRVVRAIEKNPRLLFLIRLAPYPYNVMNCLLAASPTLTLRTYTVCTALSLFKVIIHTSLGASIHSFKDYHVVTPEEGAGAPQENGASTAARAWTIFGIGLCIAILIYLSIVARRAVDEELESEEARDPEESLAFLAGDDLESGSARPMSETPSRGRTLLQSSSAAR